MAWWADDHRGAPCRHTRQRQLSAAATQCVCTVRHTAIGQVCPGVADGGPLASLRLLIHCRNSQCTIMQKEKTASSRGVSDHDAARYALLATTATVTGWPPTFSRAPPDSIPRPLPVRPRRCATRWRALGSGGRVVDSGGGPPQGTDAPPSPVVWRSASRRHRTGPAPVSAFFFSAQQAAARFAWPCCNLDSAFPRAPSRPRWPTPCRKAETAATDATDCRGCPCRMRTRR